MPSAKASPFDGVWTARFTQEGEDRGTLKVVFEGDHFRIRDEFLKSPLVSQYKLTSVMVTRFRKSDSTKFPYEGVLAVRKVTTLALSFDHRIVDGDLGSAVLSEVGAMMADPLRMLAWG